MREIYRSCERSADNKRKAGGGTACRNRPGGKIAAKGRERGNSLILLDYGDGMAAFAL